MCRFPRDVFVRSKVLGYCVDSEVVEEELLLGEGSGEVELVSFGAQSLVSLTWLNLTYKLT